MSNSTSIASLPTGVAPESYDIGFIVLGYVISVLGSLTTLELLRLRTAERGWFNWLLLVGAAFSMGAVAIFSMHYIGNRAIILYDGQPDLHLTYNVGYTILSLFLPIMVLLFAYTLIGTADVFTYWRLIIGGTFAGLAITGMHYVGQLSIMNYVSSYSVGYVVGSVIIGIVATNMALFVFFTSRKSWSDTWWKRLLCACVLAGAVSGMHWTAVVGTRYYPIILVLVDGTNSAQRRTPVIATAVVSFAACMSLLVLAIYGAKKARASRLKDQKLLVATVIFNQDGWILLNVDGTLPSKIVTDKYSELSLQETFDVDHPLFSWIYKVTYNWASVVSLIPDLRSHVRQYQSGHVNADYSRIFREMFCIAAQELSDSLRLPLTELGVAFDSIIVTGVKKPSGNILSLISRSSRATGSRSNSMSSSQSMTNSEGQIITLVKHSSPTECITLVSNGYRFADPMTAAVNVARKLNLERPFISEQLESMSKYYGPVTRLTEGTHMSIFAVVSDLHRGFKVLVEQDARFALPSLQVSGEPLMEDQQEYLLSYRNRTIGVSLPNLLLLTHENILSDLSQPPPLEMDYDLQSFRASLHGVLVTFSQQIKEPWLLDAILTSYIIESSLGTDLQCDNVGRDPIVPTLQPTAQVVLLSIIVPIHRSKTLASGSTFTFTPLSLFRASQVVLLHKTDNHSFFTRQLQEELLKESPKHTVALKNRPSNLKRWWPFKSHKFENDDDYDLERFENFGDIKVTNSVHLAVEEYRSGTPASQTTTNNAIVSVNHQTTDEAADIKWIDNCLKAFHDYSVELCDALSSVMR